MNPRWRGAGGHVNPRWRGAGGHVNPRWRGAGGHVNPGLPGIEASLDLPGIEARWRRGVTRVSGEGGHEALGRRLVG